MSKATLIRTLTRTLIRPLAVGALLALAAVPAFATMTHANLPATGLLLDGSAWATEPFAEGPGLHFTPAAKA